MERRNIVTMPGDGIGKTLLPEALRVLDAVGFKANYIPADIGWEYWRTEGDPLPRRTLDLLEKNKIGLFGAITSKPKDQADQELNPELKQQGLRLLQPHRRAAPAFQPRRLHPPVPNVQGESAQFRQAAGRPDD